MSGLVLGCLQHPAEDGAPLGAFSSGNQSLLKGVLGGGDCLERSDTAGKVQHQNFCKH